MIDLTDVGSYTFRGKEVNKIEFEADGSITITAKNLTYFYRTKQELIDNGRIKPKPKWKPEVGKVYWFWDDYEENGYPYKYLEMSSDGMFLNHCGTPWENCRPLKDEEIGK